MSRRIFITGGAGFIGSHLVRRLLSQGDAVTVFDNLSVGRVENLPEGTAFVRGDVCDAEAVERAMQGHDVLVHLAARVAIRSSFEFVVEDTQVNVVGTAGVMRGVMRTPQIARVVAASSMAVYADAADSQPITESHPCAPLSPYGVSKLALERLVHGMAAHSGKPSVVLRLFNTYGPGQALSPYVGAATIFANRLRQNQAATIYGDGEQCRDFVHVSDVAQALMLACERGAGDTLNVGTGVATSVRQLHDTIAELLGSTLAPQLAAAAAGELRNSVADVGAARRVLGYAPAVALAEGLAQTLRS